ncbi:IS66 family insertion sequence element accessory protein TnpB [Fusibacter sp. 3D3]|uniref:IS66 family insertion sequence element accessory protein TnpB n=1 Tax=Fusibacter sp. 3D3 TaxID=1048380 RepID=UPI0008531561
MLINGHKAQRVHIACGSTDMRNHIDGLAMIIKYQFNLDPFSCELFAFCNKDRNKLKILVWDHNGFWLYYKRLEKGYFKWPKPTDSCKCKTFTMRQFNWLLDGLDPFQPNSHTEVLQRQIL